MDLKLTDGAPASLISWSAPQCPFSIHYIHQVFDDIRLAIVDAFCSLPRGGAEIGGILMGQWQSGRLTISGYAPLECEHAHGPSFSLSPNDEQRLHALMAQAPAEFPGLVPVGWYHSHTRTEISLSEADLAIHQRFFPEPWQVALVLKPHMMRPTRAGFFFRETSGVIHSEAPYEEFLIEPLPMLQVPAANSIPSLPISETRPRILRMERNSSIGVVEAEAALPIPAPVPAMSPVAAPLFDPAPAPRRWAMPLMIAAVLAAVGAAGYYSRSAWLPKLIAAVRSSPAIPEAPPQLRLNAIDINGQLQVKWNQDVPAVRSAVGALLEISDGAQPPQGIVLDRAHLQNGIFTYARQNEHIDVRLIVHQPDGRDAREVTTFVGKLPDHKQDGEARSRREREELAAEATKLKSDLERQAAKSRKLERDLKSMQEEMRQQQQRRLANMLPDDK